MSNVKKHYFYAPTMDYPPGGALSLGNIIVSPKGPVPALIEVTEEMSPENLHTCQKREVKYTIEKARGGMYSIYTKFLQWILGVGADVSTEVEQKHERVYSFDKVDTVEFYPSDEYLKRRMQDAKLKTFLDQQYYDKRFYIINGVKIVRGTVVKSDTQQTTKLAVDLGVDATKLTGVPVKGGVAVKPNVHSKETVVFGASDDFVFAYQVLRVSVKDGNPDQQRIYTKGTVLDDDDDKSQDAYFEILELSPVQEPGFEVKEDEDEVVVILPN